MAKPSFSTADFTSALLGLLPRGRVWPKGLDSVHVRAVSCYAPTFQRLSDTAVGLLVDAFPATTVDLLLEWEASLRLPDPCAGPSPTLQARRAQVVARFTNSGGQSVAFFVAFAASLGYSVTVTQYAPFRVEQAACGHPLGGEEWAHTWAINSSLNTITRFRVGQSSVGEPLVSWSNRVLECELAQAKPAHTYLQFHYT